MTRVLLSLTLESIASGDRYLNATCHHGFGVGAQRKVACSC